MARNYINPATNLTLLLLVVFARSVFAQGNPDIVWQGAHTGFVRYTTFFSPDGQRLASGGDDK